MLAAFTFIWHTYNKQTNKQTDDPSRAQIIKRNDKFAFFNVIIDEKYEVQKCAPTNEFARVCRLNLTMYNSAFSIFNR